MATEASKQNIRRFGTVQIIVITSEITVKYIELILIVSSDMARLDFYLSES